MRLSSIIVLVAFTHLVSATPIDGYNRRSNSLWTRGRGAFDTTGVNKPGVPPPPPKNKPTDPESHDHIKKLERRMRGYDTTNARKRGVDEQGIPW